MEPRGEPGGARAPAAFGIHAGNDSAPRVLVADRWWRRAGLGRGPSGEGAPETGLVDGPLPDPPRHRCALAASVPFRVGEAPFRPRSNMPPMHGKGQFIIQGDNSAIPG